MECQRINNLVQQLAVSADELICGMKYLNELARIVGPYSEEELQLRRINSKRKKIWNLLSFKLKKIIFNMRKILFVMLMALMSLGVKAQLVGFQGHVDEYDLQGRWAVSSIEGRLIQIEGEFEYISFSGNQAGRLYMKQGDDYFFLLWFISNSNKLHIQLTDGHVLNFVIVDYKKGEKDYLKLKSFDDACTIELVMDWPVSHVASLNCFSEDSSPTYNLQGIKTENPEGVYIQNGKKYVSK